MVNTLDSGSNGPGSNPGRGTALCSWVRYFTLTVPLWFKNGSWQNNAQGNPAMD